MAARTEVQVTEYKDVFLHVSAVKAPVSQAQSFIWATVKTTLAYFIGPLFVVPSM